MKRYSSKNVSHKCDYSKNTSTVNDEGMDSKLFCREKYSYYVRSKNIESFVLSLFVRNIFYELLKKLSILN